MNDRYLLHYVSKQLRTIIRQYTLEGEITEKIPGISYNSESDKTENIFRNAKRWKYTPEHHFFYRFSAEENTVEIKEL